MKEQSLMWTLGLAAAALICLNCPGAAFAQNVQASTTTVNPQIKTNRQKLDDATAKAANTVPGVSVTSGQLQRSELPPIKGFHPVKRLLRPVENLESQSYQLGQQIMRLEAPIASLQPSMLGLKDKMTKVEEKMVAINQNMGRVDNGVTGAQSSMHDIRNDIGGMHRDLGNVERTIQGVHSELTATRHEINDLRQPISEVSGPLTSVHKKLDQLAALMATILLSIFVAAGAVAFGMPIAAILVYRNRKKLFPHLADHEMMPVSDMRPAGERDLAKHGAR